jgi:predicted translin family RNA/ssDNA-binding protein
MKKTLEEVAERLYSDKEYPMYGEIRRHSFIAGAKWYQEQNKKTHTALETAISLLKQTTEYEVLDNWKQKVKELEQLINKL